MSQFCSHIMYALIRFFNTNARVKPQFMHSCENANIKKVHFFLAGHITMNPFFKALSCWHLVRHSPAPLLNYGREKTGRRDFLYLKRTISELCFHFFAWYFSSAYMGSYILQTLHRRCVFKSVWKLECDFLFSFSPFGFPVMCSPWVPGLIPETHFHFCWLT